MQAEDHRKVKALVRHMTRMEGEEKHTLVIPIQALPTDQEIKVRR